MTSPARERPETGRRVVVGSVVTIAVGRLRGASGVVQGVEGNPTWGCLTVFVSTDAGEWAGTPSEVTVR